MQIESTGYHLASARMAIIKNKQTKSQKLTSIEEDVEKLESLYTVGGKEYRDFWKNKK